MFSRCFCTPNKFYVYEFQSDEYEIRFVNLVFLFFHLAERMNTHKVSWVVTESCIFVSCQADFFFFHNGFFYTLFEVRCCVTADFITRLVRENTEIRIMTKKTADRRKKNVCETRQIVYISEFHFY